MVGLLFIHYITSTKIIHKLTKGLFVPFHSNCKMTSNSVCSQFVSTSGIVYKCQIVCRRALYGRGRAIIRIYTRSVTLNSILQTPYLMVKPSNVVLKLNCLTWIGLHHEGETVFRRGRGRKEKNNAFSMIKEKRESQVLTISESTSSFCPPLSPTRTAYMSMRYTSSTEAPPGSTWTSEVV